MFPVAPPDVTNLDRTFTVELAAGTPEAVTRCQDAATAPWSTGCCHGGTHQSRTEVPSVHETWRATVIRASMVFLFPSRLLDSQLTNHVISDALLSFRKAEGLPQPVGVAPPGPSFD